MTDDERAAREWFDRIAGTEVHYKTGNARHARTILRLLDRPVMPHPGTLPLEVLDAMQNAADDNPLDSSIPDMAAAYQVLHAHLTAPPEPKKKEIWAVYASDGVCIGWHPARSIAKDWVTDPARHRLVHFVEAADGDR